MDSSAKIWQVATVIRERLVEPLRVAELAASAGMSERHFHRRFLAVIKETPAEHVMRLRLERAAAWLAYTDFPVIDAALAGGYDSREAFTRMFHARFGCSPSVFRQRLRAELGRVSGQCPETLGKTYELALPPMRIVSWPHLGAGTPAASAWLKIGHWGRRHGLLTTHTLPVSVLYDDAGITPSAHARIDAALVVAADWTCEEAAVPPFVYDLPGGRHVIAPFEGSLYQLEDAWDYFARRWLPVSGLALRDTRMLMLHDAADVPTCACDFFPLMAGRAMRCRLCIPIDRVPAPGLPPFFHKDSRQNTCKALGKM